MSFRNSMLLVLGVLLSMACSHKEVKPEREAPPQLDSDPMSFNSEGSDSKKIEGLFTIHFNYDNASLDKETKDLLAKNAEWIKAHPKVKMQIEGHCDQRGTTEYNLALGERRARAAMSYLTGLGIAKDRVSVISFGKEKPLVNGETEKDYAQNRRDNFVPIKN